MPARCVIQEASKMALEVAGLNADIAKEVMDIDAAEKVTYNQMEHEILVMLNRHKTQYPELNPVPVSPPPASTPPASTKVGAFRFERRSLPKFKGTLREYPTFKPHI